MNETNKNGAIDLGSVPAEDFGPFLDDDELGDKDITYDTADASLASVQPMAETETETKTQAMTESRTQTATESKTQATTESKTQATTVEKNKPIPVSMSYDNVVTETDEPTNPLAAAIDAAETKNTEKARQSIYAKPPVFEYAGATENIEDSSQTFDELRISKVVDFPELEDGKRVSWTVEYGKITKNVTDAKGMSVGKMKSDIETSKEFLDALKKAKDKNPICKIKPRVTAQSKGTTEAGYKGVFTNMADVEAAGKIISILPAKDGKVYEVRNTPMGRFITPIAGSDMLSDVRAGFIPAPGISLIPMDMMMRIIAFFRYFTCGGADNEVLVNIYWDSHFKEFLVDTPTQIVSKVSVHSSESPDYQNERYIHYMDIHSHNSMGAFFSATDDADEKATRLYTVIGQLDKYFPEIKTRISNGGKFHEIDPSEVFEHIALPFPEEWKDKVSFRSPHKDYGAENKGCDTDKCRHNAEGADNDIAWNTNTNKGCGDY